MKKIALVMVLLVFVGSVAIGQTTQVLSRNAVGYVKVLGEKGKLTLGRSDFEAMDAAGGIMVSNMFGNQLPDDTCCICGTGLQVFTKPFRRLPVAVGGRRGRHALHEGMVSGFVYPVPRLPMNILFISWAKFLIV